MESLSLENLSSCSPTIHPSATCPLTVALRATSTRFSNTSMDGDSPTSLFSLFLCCQNTNTASYTTYFSKNRGRRCKLTMEFDFRLIRNGYQKWFNMCCIYQAYTRQSPNSSHPCTWTVCCRILAMEGLWDANKRCALVCLARTWRVITGSWKNRPTLQSGRGKKKRGKAFENYRKFGWRKRRWGEPLVEVLMILGSRGRKDDPGAFTHVEQSIRSCAMPLETQIVAGFSLILKVFPVVLAEKCSSCPRNAWACHSTFLRKLSSSQYPRKQQEVTMSLKSKWVLC